MAFGRPTHGYRIVVSSPRLLIVFTFATALVVGVVVSLVTGSWWVLGVAIVVHAIASILVISAIGERLSQQDKPDPTEEARLEEEGVEVETPSDDERGGRRSGGEDRELVI